MIHVERPSSAPESLSSDAAEQARAEAEKFFRRRRTARSGVTHDFRRDVYAAQDVVDALTAMFHGKCAFCESVREDRPPPGVIQYRPEHMAFDLERVHPDHYWWCAYEWSNLHLACTSCALAKGSRFPVGKRRARIGATGPGLAAEEPLLLDPCVDDPEAHLIYSEDGLVTSETERGDVTIRVLDLNREWLVEARAAAVEAARAEWESSDAPPLEALYDPAHPHAGVRRQFGRLWAADEGVETVRPPVSQAKQRRAWQRHQRSKRADHDYTLRQRRAQPAYFAAAHHVERIEIRNFRLIRKLDIHVPRVSRLGAAPWLVLLGENGTGKSSVLEGVALALIGEQYRARLGLDASRFVNNRARSGSVTVHVSGFADPIELLVRKGRRDFESSVPEPKLLLLGYGPTRLLPRPGVRAPRAVGFARVDNLFNPFAPLSDSRPWLKKLSPEQFDVVAHALTRLLLLPRGARIQRADDGLRLRGFGAVLTLDDLGDGYQSVVAWTIDAMHVLLERWPSPELAEGLVVLDQIETLLHPRWRIQIVGALRSVFPRVQFLVSTHDPLCLRGLRDGETMLLRRTPDGRNAVVTELPSVRGLRVDQVLGSEIFDLESTVEPEVDRLMERYRELRWASDRTDKDDAELHKVQQRLEDLQQLGRNERERIIYEAADEYIARSGKVTTGAKRSQLRKDTKAEIAEIFAGAIVEKGGDG